MGKGGNVPVEGRNRDLEIGSYVSRGGTPLASSFLADLILLSVIWRLHPLIRPGWRATKAGLSPFDYDLSLHFNKTGMIWKKKRPEAVLVFDHVGKA